MEKQLSIKYKNFRLSHIIIITLLFGLMSCENKDQIEDDSFIGTWILKNDFNTPFILSVDQDVMKTLYTEYPWIRLYKRNGDTILTQSNFDGIQRDIIRINNDTLIYTSTSPDGYNQDTTISILERCRFPNFLDFANSKLDINIELATDSAEELTWGWNDVSFFIYNDFKNRLNIIYHGKNIEVDSLLYLEILKDIDNMPEASAILYIDKQIRFNQLTKLIDELSKARIQKLKYVVINTSRQLCQRIIYCPDIKFNYPDSLKYLNRFPKPPIPEPNVKDYYNNGILFECFQDSITINRKSSSYKDLEDILKSKENENARFNLSVFIDKNVTIEKYLNNHFSISKIYKDYSNKFAQKIFNVRNTQELEGDKYFEFLRKLWLRFYVLSDSKRNELLAELYKN